MEAVFDRVLRRMRELVRTDRYVLTTHAYDEVVDDGLTIADVEHAILTGAIVERQMDYVTGETKYLLAGPGRCGEDLTVVAKIGPTMRVVIITVFLSGVSE